MDPHEAATIPQFGHYDPAVAYILRPGGYVVLLDGQSHVRVVRTRGGIFLPGGGQDAGESAAAAAIREVHEECGLEIALARCIGVADELVFAETEGRHYCKRCTFFLAEILRKTGPGESDHELLSMSISEALSQLRHESQRWAMAQAAIVNDSIGGN